MTQQPKRNRGYVLTPEGRQKLEDAIRESEHEDNYDVKYTVQELTDRVGLDAKTLLKVRTAEEGADRSTLARFFQTFKLQLEKADYQRPVSAQPAEEVEIIQAFQSKVDWGEAVDVSIFYGRAEDLVILNRWIVKDRCRLVALLGMGGMGKTSLAIKLGEQIQGEFEYVVWRSLRNAPLVEEILVGLIQFISDQQAVDLPKSVDGLVSLLMRYLNQHRCLLILDNAESILRSGARAGQYREGSEGYGELIRRVGESVHQSCLLLTSREKPGEVGLLEGEKRPVRSFQLAGLSLADGQKILETEGVSGAEAEELLARYAGNPLAVKIAATTVQQLFSGNIASFLAQGAAVFGDIRTLLDQQFDRLTELGKVTMYWLAINRELVSFAELREDFVLPVTPQKLLETLESLERRSLIEKSAAGFTLQNVVMEYVIDRFVEQIGNEIETGNLELFNTHALIKATAKDYVRETQVRLILRPILEGWRHSESRLRALLQTVRNQPELSSGYSAGNFLNLLCYLNLDISNYDFSDLTLRQAYLKGQHLHHVNFASSHFIHPVLTYTFGAVLAVAFSPDGEILATGGATKGELYLWRVTNGQHLATYQGHTDWVRSIAFSPDGQTLASSSDDQTIRLWDLESRQCLHIFQGHEHQIRSVAFSPDGKILASGSEDKTTRLWDLKTQQCLHVLQGHTNRVRSVAFSPDGKILTSGSEDKTIRLWDLKTQQYLHVLQGHTNWVRSVAFSPDGKILASGSEDKTIRLWDLKTQQCLHVLQGHTNRVRSVAFSPDGKILASGSDDRIIRLWDLKTQQYLHVLQGHTNWVLSVAFSPNGQALASGSDDRTIRLWDLKTQQCLHILQGYTNRIFSVAISSNGQTLASGSEDQTIRLWDLKTQQCLHTLQGHTNWVWSVAFSPDETILASGSEDQTIRLWDLKTQQCLHTLQGHTDSVWSVAFSPDETILASGSEDKTIRLWDLKTQQCLHTLQGHTDRVRSIAFSPDRKTLASGSEDQTIRLWDLETQQCIHILQGHTDSAFSVAFNSDGTILASGSEDKTIRLWDLKTQQCLHILQGHIYWVWSVAFSPDGQTLASGGDQTIRLWDLQTEQCLCLHVLQGYANRIFSVTFSPDGQALASGSDQMIELWSIKTNECLTTLRVPKPYEGANITGATGLTKAQRTSMMALGAIDTSS